MMYMYLVSDWVPFPASEYGGLFCIIAENDEQVVGFLSDYACDYYKKAYPDWKERIKKYVECSDKYILSDEENYVPGIVKSFTT